MAASGWQCRRNGVPTAFAPPRPELPDTVAERAAGDLPLGTDAWRMDGETNESLWSRWQRSRSRSAAAAAAAAGVR